MALRPRPLAALPTSKISTGDPRLDHVLGGGLPCGSLTEVTGEAAASKTQLCLQLLLAVQLPQEHGGLCGSAVYVHTEGAPAMQRLHQLAQCLHLRHPPEVLAGLPAPAANVFVEKGVSSGVELLLRLQRLRSLLERQRRFSRGTAGMGIGSTGGGGGGGGCGRAVRLLVVDSVAHVFRDLGEGRAEGGAGVAELAGRTQLLFQISALLRQYADEYDLAVLLVNQVVDSVDSTADGCKDGLPQAPQRQQQAGRVAAAKNTGHTGGLRLVSLGREVVPALGLAWANCINTRLFLSRCLAPDGAGPALFYGPPSPAAAAAAAAAEGGGGGALAPALRKLQVVFAPHLARGRECFYVVEATGVRGLQPEELQQHDAAAAAAAATAHQHRQQQQEAWEREQRGAWQRQQQQHQPPQQYGRQVQQQPHQQAWQQQQQCQPPPQPGGWQHGGTNSCQQPPQRHPQQQQHIRQWQGVATGW